MRITNNNVYCYTTFFFLFSLSFLNAPILPFRINNSHIFRIYEYCFFNFTSYPMQVVSSQIEFFFTFAFSTDTSPSGYSFSYRYFSLFILLILYHIISKKKYNYDNKFPPFGLFINSCIPCFAKIFNWFNGV